MSYNEGKNRDRVQKSEGRRGAQNTSAGYLTCFIHRQQVRRVKEKGVMRKKGLMTSSFPYFAFVVFLPSLPYI